MMKKHVQHLPRALKDPQSWISLIGVVTVIGLCAGVFDNPQPPLQASVASQSRVQMKVQPVSVAAKPAKDELLALNNH